MGPKGQKGEIGATLVVRGGTGDKGPERRQKETKVKHNSTKGQKGRCGKCRW